MNQSINYSGFVDLLKPLAKEEVHISESSDEMEQVIDSTVEQEHGALSQTEV